MTILYPGTLLKVFIRSTSLFLVQSLVFLMIGSHHTGSFMLSFHTCITSICLFCLISLAKHSNIILNKNEKNGHPCLVPECRGNPLSFFLIKCSDGYRFVVYSLYYVLSMIPIFLISWGFSSRGDDKFYQKGFSAYIEMIFWFLSFILFMCCITFIDLHMANHACFPGKKTTWLWWWCMTSLMCYWIFFASILLRIFLALGIKPKASF
jgi:hypothetical protein